MQELWINVRVKYRFELLDDIGRGAEGGEGAEEVGAEGAEVGAVEGADEGGQGRAGRVRPQRHQRVGGQFGRWKTLAVLQRFRQSLTYQYEY